MSMRLTASYCFLLILAGCASAKVAPSEDASRDSNAPLDVIMPEIMVADGSGEGGNPIGDGPRRDGPAGDGPAADGPLLDSGPPLDMAPDGLPPDLKLTGDLKPTLDLKAAPDLKPTPDLKPPPDLVKPPDSKPTGTIKISTPKGGEVWSAGSKRFLTWAAKSVPVLNFDLLKSGVKVDTIALGVANTGKWAWLVPSTLSPGTSYKVRGVDAQNAKVYGISPGSFTITNWQYRVAIVVDATKAKGTLGNYPVALELNAGSFAYSHARSNGFDLRFSTSSKVGSFNIDHWVEGWNYQGDSKIWVLVSNLKGGTKHTIYMYYGHSTAGSVSNFKSTFPNRYVSSGNQSMGGTKKYDSFELKGGHTITVSQGTPLVINARRILVQGTIDGSRKGNGGGSAKVVGQGSGGGGAATGAGGGGGGYGGKGGLGGYDSGDIPGQSGNTYGTSYQASINMGSGGGGGGVSTGGDGGGAVTLSGHFINATGAIRVDGSAGGDSSQSGGGGSGGGILIKGYEVNSSATFSARGGHGGNGSSTANDGGGGGGGGRLKIFYEKLLINSGGVQLNGGGGGMYGTASYGAPGAAGTKHESKVIVELVKAKLGAEKKL